MAYTIDKFASDLLALNNKSKELRETLEKRSLKEQLDRKEFRLLAVMRHIHKQAIKAQGAVDEALEKEI